LPLPSHSTYPVQRIHVKFCKTVFISRASTFLKILSDSQ
jgi:hypothetical protein